MKILSIGLVAGFVLSITSTQAAEYLRESVAQDYEQNLDEMFRHFHRNPELSNLESKTAERLATEIRACLRNIRTQMKATTTQRWRRSSLN